MDEGDVLVLEFTRTPKEFREILLNDGLLCVVANQLSNAFGNESAFPQSGHGRPYVFVQPHKYQQVVRFLTDVGLPHARYHQLWDSMPPRFCIVDAELGSWVESLVASLPYKHNCKLRHKTLVCLGMTHPHFELQDYLAHTSHECVAGHLLTWP